MEADERTDGELVAATRGGDDRAFEVLVARTQHLLRGYVACHVANADQAEEIVQESFVRAYEKLAGFTGDRSGFSAWMHGIARNVVREHHRRRFRQRRRLADLQDFFTKRLEERQLDDPDASVEAVAALRCCIDELGDERREILRRRYYQQHSVQDIARSLKRPAATVSMILLRLRNALQGCVEQRLREASA